MYIVEIANGSLVTEIHGLKTKLKSGKITKGINTIDTFAFTLLPDNPGFSLVNEFTTLVTAYNTNKKRYDFVGRVLYAETSMDESGLITKSVTCESLMGYLCDSCQNYVDTQNWTVTGLLQHLLDCHNSQVEEHKHFFVGTVTAEDSNDNLYIGIERENTWNAIQSNLINKIGGELQFRVEEDGFYLDYLDKIGERKSTAIALSVNMKAITREQDPSSFVTRLIPLGCKLKDEETGEETEHRLDITSVAGVNYIDDTEAVELYGVHVGVVTWDNVQTASYLYETGEAWLKENNRVLVKYSVTNLDLSLLGLVLDDFEVGNWYPIKNSLLGIDDIARVIKKSIDICEEVKSSIEIGDSFKTLSDIQREQAEQIRAATENLNNLGTGQSNLITKLYKLNEKMEETAQQLQETFSSEIQQLADSIKLEVSGSLGSNASIILSAGANKYTGEISLSKVREAFANDQTAISISAGTITFNSNTLVINSSYFTLSSSGYITATGGTIGGWTLKSYKLYAGDGEDVKTVCVQAPTASNLYVFAAGGTSHDSYGDCPFRVTKGGKLYASDAVINGEVTTIDGNYKVHIHDGSVDLYYGDILRGSLNTKYLPNASMAGINLCVEQEGSYLAFTHYNADTGRFVLDYYLNNGYSSSYEERHIFQTAVRFVTTVTVQNLYSMQTNMPRGSWLFASDYDSGDVLANLIGMSYSSDEVMVGDYDYDLYLCGPTVYLQDTGATVTSDRNKKNSIEELPEEYEAFIDSLEPVRFKYNNGKSGRYHVGYIAQDVETALTTAGLSSMDFAGYVHVQSLDELGLQYHEFIAVLHKKIKRLEQRIAVLENGSVTT